MKKTLVMWLMGACALSQVTATAQTAASAIESKKQTLFSSVNHESTPYRIPAIATLNNGTVLAIADQRPCGADVGNGEVDIYAKVGTIAADGTYSWNPSSADPSVDGGLKIADGTSSNGYGDAAVVVDRESGKVLVICVSGKVVFSSGSSSKHNKMARIVGSADGLTWQSPEDVTTAFFDNLLPSAYTMFMASGRMIQSQHVKVGDYYRIYGVLLVREKSGWFSKSNNNYVVYSDDFGASWSILGGSYCLKGGDEAKVEELPNGDLVMSSRTSGGRYYNVFNFTNLNSASGSWGSATKYSFGGSNSTNGELMLYKGLTDANGTAYNVMLQSLPTGSSRSNVAVYYKAFATDKSSWAVSDFTSGWTKGIEVDNGASAYSTMTILPNGEIGFLYEDDYDTDKASGDYSNIKYVPLTASEITGGAYVSNNGDDDEEVVEPVDPEISLSAAATTLTVGKATQLTLTTNSDGAVTYTSSNENVVTVNANGVVTAVAAGSATITASVAATEQYNAASATVTITVNKVNATISLSAATATLTAGETTQLTATTNSDGAVTYTSSNTNVATVNANGVVTAVAAGSATITASVAATTKYTAASATATITVEAVVEPEEPVTPVDPEISLSAAAATLTVGETTQLTLTTNSDGAVTYTSSNTAVATVNANGVVTAVAAGSATITANVAATEQYNAASATATITVNKVNATISLSAAAATLTVGETTQLTATTNSDGAVTYTSSNTAVATVNANGVVTAVAAGSATITASVAATTKYTAASATATITVEAVVEPEEPETPEVTLATWTVTLQQGKLNSSTKYIAAFSADRNVQLPDGVTAYYVSSVFFGSVYCSAISGSVIPANTGVILCGSSAGEITVTEADADASVASVSSSNKLVSTAGGAVTLTSTSYYVLKANSSGVLTFSKSSNGTVVPQNSAYVNSGSSWWSRSIDGEGGATAIDEVESADAPVEYYDMSGAKVEADDLTPGIYIRRQGNKTTKIVVR